MISHQTFLIKPSSSNCNLSCDYCFYHKIATSRKENFGYMSNELTHILLTKVFKEVSQNVNFIFQGGEPLLIGIDYYKYFTEQVTLLNKNKIQVSYALQTNGTKIDDEFASFFKKNNFLIGVSLDGTKDIHNYYRNDSFNNVINAIEILKKHHVEFNVLSVITKMNVTKAKEIYQFFKSNGFAFQQYIPYLEVTDQVNNIYQPNPLDYGKFLVELFDLWSKDVYDNNGISVSNFEDIIKNMLGLGRATCGMNGMCSLNLVVEANGNIYPCDFFTSKEDYIGNIHSMSLSEIVSSDKAKNFLSNSKIYHSDCYTCNYKQVCKGGCKAYKNSNNSYYYCRSFKHLFSSRTKEFNTLAQFFYDKLFKHQ